MLCKIHHRLTSSKNENEGSEDPRESRTHGRNPLPMDVPYVDIHVMGNSTRQGTYKFRSSMPRELGPGPGAI